MFDQLRVAAFAVMFDSLRFVGALQAAEPKPATEEKKEEAPAAGGALQGLSLVSLDDDDGGAEA